jgi:hypothetical protein
MIKLKNEPYRVLNVLVDYFTEYARVKVSVKGEITAFEAFRHEDYAYELAASAIAMARNESSALSSYYLSEALYQNKRVRIATAFGISIAAEVYSQFGAEIVFDPFAGWGDRVLGAALSTSVHKYVGVDANSNLVQGYADITSFLSSNQVQGEYKLITSATEDYDFSDFADEKPDLCFSSPPFFDFEDYSRDSSESHIKYSKYKRWMNEWFLPLTDKCWDNLKVGGHLIYHIGDIGQHRMVHELVEHMRSKSRHFRGSIPVASGQRGISVLMYVWYKTLI